MAAVIEVLDVPGRCSCCDDLRQPAHVPRAVRGAEERIAFSISVGIVERP